MDPDLFQIQLITSKDTLKLTEILKVFESNLLFLSFVKVFFINYVY